MMNKVILAVLVLFMFSSCRSLKVTQHNDKTIDISKSKTYSYNGWFGETDDLFEIDTKAYEKAFAAELKKRGMTYKEQGGDIVISIMTVVSKEATQNRYNRYYGGGYYGFYQPTWGWGSGYGPTSGPAGVPYKENAYLQGTLIIDVFDTATKKLAWQAVASKAIDPNANQNRASNIPAHVAKILNKFPVPVVE